MEKTNTFSKAPRSYHLPHVISVDLFIYLLIYLFIYLYVFSVVFILATVNNKFL